MGEQLQVKQEAPLGEGGFGVTYKGQLAGSDVVAKVLKQEQVKDFEESFAAEVDMLYHLLHANLVIMQAIYPANMCIVTEWCPHSDLAHFLRSNSTPPLPDAARLHLAMGVCSCMVWLAYNQVIHSDLKLQNILIKDGPTAVVADFGLASNIGESDPVAGSRFYMAPEMSSGAYSEKSDMFAFSTVLACIFGAADPYDADSFLLQRMQQQLEAQGIALLDISPSTPPAVREVIERAWEHDPARPTFEEVATALESLRISWNTPAQRENDDMEVET